MRGQKSAFEKKIVSMKYPRGTLKKSKKRRTTKSSRKVVEATSEK